MHIVDRLFNFLNTHVDSTAGVLIKSSGMAVLEDPVMDTRRNDRGFNVRPHSSMVNCLGPAARRIREDSCSVEINLVVEGRKTRTNG